MEKFLRTLLSLVPVVYGRAVLLHRHFSVSTLLLPFIRMSLDEHRAQNRGVRVACLHNAKLVGNRKRLQSEILVTDLDYADDMAIVADSWDDLEAMLTTLAIHCHNLGLSISCAKTKSMGVLPSKLLSQPCLSISHLMILPLSLYSTFNTW